MQEFSDLLHPNAVCLSDLLFAFDHDVPWILDHGHHDASILGATGFSLVIPDRLGLAVTARGQLARAHTLR